MTYPDIASTPLTGLGAEAAGISACAPHRL